MRDELDIPTLKTKTVRENEIFWQTLWMSFARYHDLQDPGFLDSEIEMLNRVFPDNPPTGPVKLPDKRAMKSIKG